jgi:hypothetical protein
MEFKQCRVEGDVYEERNGAIYKIDSQNEKTDPLKVRSFIN